VEIEETLTQFK